MKEKDIQIYLTRFLKDNWKTTGAFELKITKTPSLAFNMVAPHQLYYLQQAKRKIVWKIADAGMSRKPFDCFCIVAADAYLVVMFYKRGQKEAIFIDVDDWLNEVEVSKRKSIREERAKEIGDVYLIR